MLFGTVLAFCVDGVRLLPIPFGIHTISGIILLFLFLIMNSKGDYSLSLIASLSSIMALIICETVSMSLLLPYLGVTPKAVLLDPVLNIVTAVPQILVLFAMAFLLRRNIFKPSL
ncbi:MAG TPA: hypothetical protein VIM51_10530 [Desulfosporosinus sp.]